MSTTPDILLNGWARGLERDLPQLESRMTRIQDEASRGRARMAMKGLDRVALSAIAVHGAEGLRPFGDRLAPLVAQAIAEENQERIGSSVTWTLLTLADTWNALSAAGFDTSPETSATVADWLPRMSIERDDPDTIRFYWRLGFAALALYRPPVYYAAAGYRIGGSIPFTPGARPGLNLQAALAHLAGAVEARASIDDVMPMWWALLGALPDLLGARVFDLSGLVWVARTMVHRLAARPLSETADFVRDSISRVARASAR